MPKDNIERAPGCGSATVAPARRPAPRGVEVVDGQVEVELLAAVLVRPARGGVPLDAAEAEGVARAR